MNTSDITLTTSTYYPTTVAIKSGRLIQLRCSGLITKDIDADLELSIGTLAANYRPQYQIIYYVLGGYSTSRLWRIKINTDGTVTYTMSSGMTTGGSLNLNIVYIAK